MKFSRRRFLSPSLFIAVAFTLGLTTANTAWAVGDVAVVNLRTDCTGVNDCFNNITDLNNWLSGTRQPSTTKRTLVNIGSGTFGGALGLTCSGGTTGYVSFKGAGRDVTSISNSSANAITFNNCTSISVQDLQAASNADSVAWTGGGSSNWTNVGITSTGGKAWYGVAGSGGCARHNFFSVTMAVLAFPQGSGIYNSCGDMWVWGSEISVSAINYSSGSLTGILVTGTGNQVHLYGSDVRITSTSNAAVTNPIGLVAQAGGVIHFHGGEVVVRYSNTAANVSVVGASADGAGSLVHTIETSYGLGATGSGTATRATQINGGSVQSVFQWPAAGNTPLVSSNSSHLTSLSGQDSYVENDCPLATKCLATPGSSDKYPHLMIYVGNTVCSGTTAHTGPWYDSITNKCRGI